jgi:hypothetical protein
MRPLTCFVLLLILTGPLFSQRKTKIGQLKLLHATIIKTDTVKEEICGSMITGIRFTISARTKVQLSCNYGNPSQNLYDTIRNTVYLFYGYDTSGIVHEAILSEIKLYIVEQEEYAKQYNSGRDFSYLPFNKSFFVNKDKIIPFIWSGAERTGDYQIFYLNKRFYKILLMEDDGLGCLSSFAEQNMYFIQGDKKMKLGEYIKNLDKARAILANQ